jgi:hypothetical protein
MNDGGYGADELTNELWRAHDAEAERLELEFLDYGFYADETCVRSVVRLEEPIGCGLLESWKGPKTKKITHQVWE